MNKSERYIRSKQQAKFCQELMNRINEDVIENSNDNDPFSYAVNNYTSIRNYIVILRKELNKLSDVLSDIPR